MSKVNEEDGFKCEGVAKYIYQPRNEFLPIWDMYLKARSCFWTPGEVMLEKDAKDFETKLNDGERHLLKFVLAFFATADGIVVENLINNFKAEIEITEAKSFFQFQTTMEQIHGEQYADLLKTYIKDTKEIDEMFSAMEHVPSIKRKMDWAIRYMDRNNSNLRQRVIAFGCLEGICFSSAFASVFYFKEKNVLPGLIMANSFIIRDEGLHQEFSALLYSYFENPLPVEQVHKIIEEAVDVESAFVRESLPMPLIGLNKETMITYVQFVADYFCNQLRVPKLYNVKNPLPYMESIGYDTKENFFERQPSNYALRKTEGNHFSTEADF